MSKSNMKKLMEMCPPQRLQLHIEALVPNIWACYDFFESDVRNTIKNWPASCYAPFSYASGLVMHANINNPKGNLDAEIAATAAWRQSKYAFYFNRTLFDELVSQPIKGDMELPAEVLLRMPAYGVYIDTYDFYKGSSGVIAWLDYDLVSQTNGLRFLLLKEFRQGEPQSSSSRPRILLDGALADSFKNFDDKLQEVFIEECPDKPLQKWDKTVLSGFIHQELSQEMVPLLQLVLYICASNADIQPMNGSRQHTIVKSNKPFQAVELQKWSVGARIGPALARHKASDTEIVVSKSENHSGKSYRAHIRRAHWHTYICGPKHEPEKQVRQLRWLPPIPINVESSNDLPVTIRLVK